MVVKAAKAARDSSERALYDYKDGMVIYDRFTHIPPPGGARMLASVKEYYGLKELQNITVPWFNAETGQPNFVPHEENVREHDSVVDSYAESIVENGVAADCRGRCFCVASNTPSGFPYRLITWGTLGRAAYAVFADREVRAHGNINQYTYIHAYRHTYIPTYRHTYRHTDTQTYRHTDIQT